MTSNWIVYASPKGTFDHPYVPSQDVIEEIKHEKENKKYSFGRNVANFFRIGFGLSPLEED